MMAHRFEINGVHVNPIRDRARDLGQTLKGFLFYFLLGWFAVDVVRMVAKAAS